jgi:hypothetical protein
MERVLFIVLSETEINHDGIGFHVPSRERENTAIGRGDCANTSPSSDSESLLSQIGWLQQWSHDCQIAMCLPEAMALLGVHTFDVVVFDLAVFDGSTHRLMSRLNDSSASQFSRLDVEKGCWWLPTEIALNSHERIRALCSKSSELLLKEICGRLSSNAVRNPVGNSTILAERLAG